MGEIGMLGGGGGLKIEIGSYVGTGASTKVFTFNGEPQFIMIQQGIQGFYGALQNNDGRVTMVRGVTQYAVYSGQVRIGTLTWGSNSITFTMESPSAVNESAVTYTYLVLLK